MPQSNIYSASAEEIGALFGDYLEGDASHPVLAVSESPLGATAHNAIGKSLASFGYGDDACTYATLHPAAHAGGDVTLDPHALFLLVEGLDPLCVICTDAVAADVLGHGYRTRYEPDSAARVFGRPAVVLHDLNASLETEAGKQHVWHLLKSLPKRRGS